MPEMKRSLRMPVAVKNNTSAVVSARNARRREGARSGCMRPLIDLSRVDASVWLQRAAGPR